ncbi:MAG: hypothetical protein LGR52_14485 [Candidatus Thiosymbion ectosymbiont of Robbea hypermnestra]|nr:hypothetical protein [Candidatus Thiosymbion ectosymbiont of Robbea hypermnestra]
MNDPIRIAQENILTPAELEHRRAEKRSASRSQHLEKLSGSHFSRSSKAAICLVARARKTEPAIPALTRLASGRFSPR